MTTPVWVGFYVNNASGVGLNTCTFTGLSVTALNKAPVVSATASNQIKPIALDGTITDNSPSADFTSLLDPAKRPQHAHLWQRLAHRHNRRVHRRWHLRSATHRRRYRHRQLL